MSRRFIELNGNKVICSGSIAMGPRDILRILPFEDTLDYFVEIRVIFHDKDSENETELKWNVGAEEDGKRVWLVQILRNWAEGAISSHRGIPISQSEREESFANFIVRPIGTRDDYALGIDFLIFALSKDAA